MAETENFRRQTSCSLLPPPPLQIKVVGTGEGREGVDFAGDRVGEKVWKGCRWFSVFEDNLIALDYLFYFIFSSRRDEGILSKERERESETVIYQ